MKKTKNKWSTTYCGRCSEAHNNYTGKLDVNGIEYVICGNTHKRMNVSGTGAEGNTSFYPTIWILKSEDQIQEQIVAIKKVVEGLSGDAQVSTQFLIDAGIIKNEN